LRYWRWGGTGWDSAWEQEKPETRKMLKNAAESPPSTSRFLERLHIVALKTIPLPYISQHNVSLILFNFIVLY